MIAQFFNNKIIYDKIQDKIVKLLIINKVKKEIKSCKIENNQLEKNKIKKNIIK